MAVEQKRSPQSVAPFHRFSATWSQGIDVLRLGVECLIQGTLAIYKEDAQE